MPAPYSKDLRQKAIAAVELGERKIDVSWMLKLSRNTHLPVAEAKRTNGPLSSHYPLSASCLTLDQQNSFCN